MDENPRSCFPNRTTRRYSRLTSCRLVFLVCLMYVVEANSQFFGKCPEKCFCHPYYHPSDGPSVRVECKRGGLRGIPVNQLERDIHQLIIAPQPNDPNFITIGPILTQPVPFSNLRDLTITNSNVPSIGLHSFWGLVNLRTLNLTGNNISSITTESFRGLINLSALYLDFNQIGQMVSETFSYMVLLKRLSLAHNKITNLVPRLFMKLGNLESLNLSYNPLGELNPEVFKDIQGLIEFKCRKCMLRRVNVQIYHLSPQIEKLDLGQNLFKYLTDDDFTNLKKLKTLLFDGNQVSVIVDNVFHGNTQLRYLKISSNRIALLSAGAFANLTNLDHLDISNNRLDKFVLQTFAPVVKTLTRIDFSGNNLPLHEIAVVLQILPGIQEVGLANLSLRDIPQNFFMFNTHLTSLDLSFNLLTRFPLKLLTNTKFLQNLDVSNNKLSSLSANDLRRLEAIANINLSQNPWQCDQCTLRPIFIYMKTTVLNETIRSLRCQYPRRLRGLYFSEITSELLDQCSTTFEAKMSIVAGLVLVLMSVLMTGTVALCCTRRRGARYYTNEEKRKERDHEHPEELLASANNGSVSTIHSPYHQTPESS